MKAVVIVSIIFICAAVKGNDFDLWTCGYYSPDGWIWACDNSTPTLASTYEIWAGGSVPPLTQSQAVYLSDLNDYQFAVQSADQGIKRFMCEVDPGDVACPGGYGRMLAGTHCWKMASSPYPTWSQARESCQRDPGADLVVIETDKEYQAIRRWLVGMAPATPAPTPAPTTPDQTTAASTPECESTTASSDSLHTTTPPLPQFTDVTLEDITSPSPTILRTPAPDTSSSSKPSSTPDARHDVDWRTPRALTQTTAQPVTPPFGLAQFLRTAPPDVESEVEDMDKRASAITIGVTAMFLCIGFLLFICILDTTSWYRDCKKLRRNLQKFKGK